MSWLSVTTVDTGMMHFIDLVCCFKWSVSSAVIEATGSWMWLQFYPVSATSVDGFMCFYHTTPGRYVAAECLPDGVLNAVEMAVL